MSFPLYLVRHGEAGIAPTDESRPLTESGRSHVISVAKRFCGRQDWGSLRIYASPYLRAQQTAAIWKEVLGWQREIVEEPGVTPEGNVIQFTRKLSTQDCAWLVVSHYPFVPTLASYLLTGQRDRVQLTVRTGTIISLSPEGPLGRPGGYCMDGLEY